MLMHHPGTNGIQALPDLVPYDPRSFGGQGT